MLHDFMLKLDADVPALDKPLGKISSIGATEQAKITNSFHNTIINVTGDRNTKSVRSSLHFSRSAYFFSASARVCMLGPNSAWKCAL